MRILGGYAHEFEESWMTGENPACLHTHAHTHAHKHITQSTAVARDASG